MAKKHGPWTLLASKCTYKTPWMTVYEDSVISKAGKKTKYSWIKVKSGTTVVPIDAKGNVYLAREYRYPLKRRALECMSGGIEAGDTPLQTAKRELKEELGVIAKRWKHLGTYDSISSQLKHQEHLFLAEELTFSTQSLEGTEDITVVSMPLSRALSYIRSGKITCGFTVLALLFAAAELQKR